MNLSLSRPIRKVQITIISRNLYSTDYEYFLEVPELHNRKLSTKFVLQFPIIVTDFNPSNY